MLKNIIKLLIITFCFNSSSAKAFNFDRSTRSRTIAILDLTSRNNESTDAEIYSVEHFIRTAGLPYIITQNVDTAIQYGVILGSSNFSSSTFNAAEKDSLIQYVSNGGTLIANKVQDTYLCTLFGISQGLNTNTQHYISFDTSAAPMEMKWLNDSMERVVSLGKLTYATTVSCRAYSLGTATALAYYEDSSVAMTVNSYGTGKAYALGWSHKTFGEQPQLNRDVEAQRIYCNGFEPSADAVMLLIKGICLKSIDVSVYLHSSLFNSKSTLMITHDIDASVSYDTMLYYADYEDSMNISSDYLFTTHYLDDGFLSPFYDSTSIPKIQYVLNKGQIVGSHSVGHFPDFADETIFPLGVLGNTTSNYLPFNPGNGGPTVGGTVLGEAEVSKSLLENDLGVIVNTYRTGYLCFNDKLINGLDTLGYKYNSSLTAGDVLTAFPYKARKDRSYSGTLTNVREFPLSISDLFRSDPISSTNYPQKVAQWLDVTSKEMDNNAPIVLLIHPTNMYKLQAQRDYISQLPQGIFITNIERFGDFWERREQTELASTLTNDTLTITIPSYSVPLDSSISLIVDNGRVLSSIKMKDELGNEILFQKEDWNSNDVLIHYTYYAPNTTGIYRTENVDLHLKCSPNPAKGYLNISFINKGNSFVEIVSAEGKIVAHVSDFRMAEEKLLATFNTSWLAEGIYFCKVISGGNIAFAKIVVVK